MREYMRGYRAQTRLSCLILFLPFLGMGGLSLESLNFSFEEITTGIIHAEILVFKVSGLAYAILHCVRYLKHAWKDKDGDKEK